MVYCDGCVFMGPFSKLCVCVCVCLGVGVALFQHVCVHVHTMHDSEYESYCFHFLLLRDALIFDDKMSFSVKEAKPFSLPRRGCEGLRDLGMGTSEAFSLVMPLLAT